MYLFTPFACGALYWAVYGTWWGMLVTTLTGLAIWGLHLVQYPITVERPAQTRRRLTTERDLACLVLVLCTFACALGAWR
jgi:hypothetical protein